MVVGDDVTRALLDFARAVSATQLVLGTSRRNRVSRLMFRGIGETVIALSGDIDVHMVTHERAGKGRWPAGSWGRFEPRRQLAALAAAIIAPPALAALLTQFRGPLNLTSQVLVFLVALVAIARLGGLLPALLAAVSSSLLLNYYFIPPIHQFTIADPNNIFALVAFVLVALTVASVVDTAGRQSRRAAHASAEAQTLATLSGSVLRGEQAIPALLERSREAFGMESVALLERSGRDDWRIVAATGPRPCTSPADGDAIEPVSEGIVLVLRGRVLPASDQRVLTAFAAQAGVALEQARLAAAAAAAKPLAEADRMRTALLAAVSHDLRTPLASAKAAVTSLRSHDVDWSLEDSEELLATADESLDRLTRMVENLLDMSRLQAGALSLSLRPVTLDEIVPLALDGLGFGMAKVQLGEMDDVPQILADPGLLERVVANLVSNAVKHSPPGQPVLITASSLAGRVELRVTDRGPGIPREDRERVFQPFQRFGDRNNETGVGLGLALARGLVEAMGGSLEPEDTPGGGLTMVISLPVGGSIGTAGTTGTTGTTGAFIPLGTAGSAGTAGPADTVGSASSAVDPTGTTGTTGTAGDASTTGTTGGTGTSLSTIGITGTSDTTGTAGTAGTAGIAGTAGTETAGLAGITGTASVTGTKGTKGTTRAAGVDQMLAWGEAAG